MGCSLKFLGEPLAAENIHACPLDTLAFGRSGIASNTGTMNGVLTTVKHCKPASSLPESCFPFPEHSDVQEGVRDDPHRHPHPSEVSGVHVAWREAHSLPQLAASTLACALQARSAFTCHGPADLLGFHVYKWQSLSNVDPMTVWNNAPHPTPALFFLEARSTRSSGNAFLFMAVK